MRGCQPGGEAQDWFHAEGEVLAFLIANESTRAAEPPTMTGQVTEVPEATAIQEEPVKKRAATKSKSPRSAQGTKTTRQSTAAKQATTKKSTKPKTKSVRSRNSSKQESTE